MKKSLIILAGGKSTRMKINKETLKKDGELIIINNIKRYEEFFDDIVVVTNSPNFYKDENVVTTCDIHQSKGPLAGIHAGLVKIKNDSAYVIACDMPYFDEAYLKYVYQFTDDFNVIVSTYKGYIEPFQGIYNKELIPTIEQLLLTNRLAISNLFDIVKTKYINFDNTNFKEYIFVNMNYKKDYFEYLEYKGSGNIVKTKKNIKSSR